MSMRHRLRRILRHLFVMWPLFTTVGVPIGFFLLASLFAHNLSEQTRYSGTWLQVSGLILVAKGLADLRRIFDRPTLRSRLNEWLRNIPKLMKKPEPVVLHAEPGKSEMTGYAPSFEVGRSKNKSIEQRLEGIESDIENIRLQINNNDKKNLQEFKSIREELQSAKKELSKNHNELRSIFEEVSVGGIHLEMMGLIWIVLGVIFTSIPNEIAKLFSFLFS
jgi:hypothetical protein